MRTFTLTVTEQTKADAFEYEHRHKEIYAGAIGGGLTYSFSPNGLGLAVEIECTLCDTKENITDYDMW